MVNLVNVKEHPILVNAWEVRSILDGHQTQIRRIVKPMRGRQSNWLTQAKINNVPHGRITTGSEYGWQMHHPYAEKTHRGVYVAYDSPYGWIRCPYGKPGDGLWVRETWAILKSAPHKICFRYDAQHPDGRSRETLQDGRWRPSIHMPRYLRRIQLRVKTVRVERVNDISKDDAIAEGIYFGIVNASPPIHSEAKWVAPGVTMTDIRGEKNVDIACHNSPQDAFECLWQSINDKRGYGWYENPWVWVVEFEVIDKKGS